MNKLFSLPLLIIIPESLVGAPVSPEFNPIIVSATFIFVVLIAVVVPFTLKFPVITASPATAILPPTFKFFPIPIPPVTLRAPVAVLVLSVESDNTVEPLAVNVVNVAELGVTSPIIVPSIDPELISTLGNTVKPLNVTDPLANVIKSVSLEWPIVVPSITRSSTFNSVKVPTNETCGNVELTESVWSTPFVPAVRPVAANDVLSFNPVEFSKAVVPDNCTAEPATLFNVVIWLSLSSPILPANVLAGILPANIAFVIVPTSPVVTTVPVTLGNVITLLAVGSSDTNLDSNWSDVAPSNTIWSALTWPLAP